ncbi:MAG: hypothetical protein IJV72_04165 [Clostridia bacterium]|nr:hypothetical protein [Clostridia bacterium]
MNKFIKLLFALALSLCIILAFAACDETDTESGEDTPEQTTISPSEDGGTTGNGGNGGNGGDSTTAGGKINVADKDDSDKNWGPLSTVPR